MPKDGSALEEKKEQQIPAFYKKEYNEIQKNFKGIFDQSMVNSNPDYSIVDKIKKVPELQAAKTSQRFSETGALSGSGTKYGSGMQTKKTFAAAGKETFRNLGLKMNNTSGLDGAGDTLQQSGALERSPQFSTMDANNNNQMWGPPIHHKESGPLGYPMQPCNQEIMASQYAQMMAHSPSSQYNFQDFMQKNIGDLKTFKSRTLQDVKKRIEFIHSKLRSKNNLGADLLELQAIEQHLPDYLRTSFIQLPHHGPILKDLQDLNSNFVPVLDFLCSYKTEFGVLLQRMVESYNVLLLMQFEGFYKNDNATKQQYEQKLQELDQKMKDVDHQLAEFATQKEMAKGLIQGKDKIIEQLQERNDFLEKLMVDLTAEVTETRAEKSKKADLLKEKAKKIEESKKIQNDSDQDSNSSSSSSEIESDSASASAASMTSSQCAKRDLDDFAQAISDSNTVISERTQFILGLNKIVQKALKKGYAETYVQTNPIEIGGPIKEDDNDMGTTVGGVSKESNNRGSMRGSDFTNPKRGTTMLGGDQIIVEENFVPGSVNNQNLTKSTMGGLQASLGGDDPNQMTSVQPFENSNSAHAKTAIQMGQIDPVTMSLLNKRLILLLQKPIKGSLAKQLADNKNALDMGKYIWSNPQFVLLFLKPAIERYTVAQGDTARPVASIKITIAPWDTFKKQLYEIYDHRIVHAPEIQGTVNTTYLTLDEHLLVYFLEKNHTRAKVENALIEFLATLKYYSESWERAKMYAQLSGFMQYVEVFSHVDDKTGTGLRVNDGEICEVDVPIVDMYLQEFYLHGYAYLKKEQRSFVESKEGFTYIRLQNEERITSKLLTFNQSIEKQGKWQTKIRQNIKKIKQNPLDDFDTDFIDIDTLQSLYIAEFREAKRQIQNELISRFNVVIQENKERNALSSTTGMQVIKDVTKKNKIQQPAVSFAGNIGAMRGMIYAFMCSTNGADVNDYEFLAGCNRFAIDNPLPTVTKRIAYYGNNDDVAKQLDAFAADLKDPSVIEVGQFTSVNVAMDRGRGPLSMDPAAARERQKDLGETSIIEPKKRQKFAAVKDLTMLAMSTDGKGYDAPAEDVRNRGVVLKVKDINSALQKKTELNKSGVAPDRSFRMTSLEVGIQGEKQLIVPSFGMTSSLFIRHCEILRQLRKRIALLKQAYTFQLDESKCWDQVDAITDVLERGIAFLGFDDVVQDANKGDLPLLYEDPTLEEDKVTAQEAYLSQAANRIRTPKIDVDGGDGDDGLGGSADAISARGETGRKSDVAGDQSQARIESQSQLKAGAGGEGDE